MIDLLAQHPVLAALAALAGLALVFGALLGFASERFAVDEDPIVEQILDKLPQTQCGQCGYPGCRPYAEAIAAGEAINKCPPGGQATINALATLLNVEAPALDAEHGVEKPRMVAWIREDECIGCTKCIQACPVDAILGAAKQMHTVIGSECTGCDLCVEPCPVDCIEMIPVPTTPQTWRWELPQREAAAMPAPTRAQIIATDAPGSERVA
ncbi:MAG TPA: electron transport complex subunit RsxB [Pseudomonadales bacterium]|nr:electron transport complex subunit RsxB [Pseudomonadales bacterium]